LCASVGIIKMCFDTVDAQCKHEDIKHIYLEYIYVTGVIEHVQQSI
jgi:hypothetical protein